jgi:hypothetical protein
MAMEVRLGQSVPCKGAWDKLSRSTVEKSEAARWPSYQ